MKIIRTIIAGISILGILGQLGQIGSPANQAGVFGVMFFWLFILIISMYGNKQIGSKPKKEHSSIITITVGVIVGIAGLIALGTIYSLVTADSTPQPVVATESVQVPEPEQKEPVEQPEFSDNGIFNLVNQYRKDNDLLELKRIPELDASALEKCNQVIETYGLIDLEHIDTETGIRGIELAYKHYGKTTYYSENLRADGGGNQSVVNGWKNSPAHNAGMLNKDITVTGIAICSTDMLNPNVQKITVQHFAQ